MTGSIFDDFAPQDSSDATAPLRMPGAEQLGSALPADAYDPYARPAGDPVEGGYGRALLGEQLPPPPPTGPFAPALGEVPYVHSVPRAARPLRRRVVVAAGSLAAGALAAGGAAFAIGGGDDPSVALASTAGSPSKTGEAPVDDSTRTQDVSRGESRPGMCVRLDAAALAAITKAENGPQAGAGADGRTVTIRLAGGDVTVPMSSVTVVKCSVPAAKQAPSSSSSKATTARTPAPASTSRTTAPRSSTTTTRPKATTTTTTRPKTTTTTTRPKTTTTPPKTTSTTPKPKPSSSTKTSAS